APNTLKVKMMTGRYTDNLLGFDSTGKGLMISTCYSYDLATQLSYCPTYPKYQYGNTGSNCAQAYGNIGWTQTKRTGCSA
ncbi:hypothetical protein PENTCL1PPCAC_8943, partial [Pristionchus entomophagus]